VQSPVIWSVSPDWKLDYCNIARMSPEEIRQRRAEFEEQKNVARTVREDAGVTAARNEMAEPAGESSFA
jgi:D-proline reductase (dithiol) PrdB